MICPVCKFNKPISYWMSLKDQTTKTMVSPKVSYYTRTGSQQDNVYACPQCGVLKVIRPGDR